MQGQVMPAGRGGQLETFGIVGTSAELQAVCSEGAAAKNSCVVWLYAMKGLWEVYV